MEEVDQLSTTDLLWFDTCLRLVEEFNALVLQNNLSILLTDVSEASKCTSSSIHCFDDIVRAENNIIEHLAVS